MGYFVSCNLIEVTTNLILPSYSKYRLPDSSWNSNLYTRNASRNLNNHHASSRICWNNHYASCQIGHMTSWNFRSLYAFRYLNLFFVHFFWLQPLADVLMHVERGYRLEAPEGCPHDVYDIMQKAWDLDAHVRPTFADVCVKLNKLRHAPPLPATPVPPASSSLRPPYTH